MIGAPKRDESDPYYYRYIDRISTDDITAFLHAQLAETLAFLESVSEERSLHSYAPGKWCIREVLNHINDTERELLFWALWFARATNVPLPGFEQETAVAASGSKDCSWSKHIQEFRTIRLATHSFFLNLPTAAWFRTGVASGGRFTVRAVAYVIAGHVSHHVAILRERYLLQM
jgi:hypothetical protein